VGPSDTLPAIYLDHAATSWPKPAAVVDAVVSAFERYGANPGRGAYRMSLDTSRAIHAARRNVAGFLGVENARDLLFCPGCTYAINLVLRGVLKPGDRVVTTSVEHNAVARPLLELERRGVRLSVVRSRTSGEVDVGVLEAAIADGGARVVVFQHAGNLTGAIQPVAEIAAAAHAAGALAVVDGAQAGGHLPVELAELGVDAWACSGHKGLLGPQGIGVLWLARGCNPDPLVAGGTGGGSSESPAMPAIRPDRYEAGTPNTPGILGLSAGVTYLSQHAETIRATEAALARRLHEGILALPGFRVLGPSPEAARVPVVAAVHDSIEAGRLGADLDRRWGIAVRAGLHCAPWAHESVGTLRTGALRFGIGWSTTQADIDRALEALATVERGLR
jgi:cysteine desulfurase family protein